MNANNLLAQLGVDLTAWQGEGLAARIVRWLDCGLERGSGFGEAVKIELETDTNQGALRRAHRRGDALEDFPGIPQIGQGLSKTGAADEQIRATQIEGRGGGCGQRPHAGEFRLDGLQLTGIVRLRTHDERRCQP